MTFYRAGIALAAFLTASGPAAAEDWPTRPVTMVIPFAAGGPTDAVGRVVAQHLGETLGQHVVVENVGGAGGMTGASRVVHAAPDGYVFLFGGAASQVFNQILYKKPLYNSRADFAPVALLTEQASVLVARKDLPANSLAEFARYLKGNKTASFGSAGVGSSTHLGCLLLNGAIGVDITHVPYRGAAPAMQDLIAGRIDYMCDLLPDVVGHIRSGEVKPIAMLARVRSAILPDVPTADEQGLAGFEATSWYGLFLPKDTPGAIVRKLHDAAIAAVDAPALRDRLRGLGVEIVPPDRRGSDYLARFIGEEIAKWSTPIQANGIAVH
jgi:tripartite-type tricarboxylate transporter receptor subunit TctC